MFTRVFGHQGVERGPITIERKNERTHSTLPDDGRCQNEPHLLGTDRDRRTAGRESAIEAQAA